MKIQYVNPFNDTKLMTDEYNSRYFTSPETYFLSRDWILSWLSSLPKNLNIKYAILNESRTPIAVFFIGKRMILRKTGTLCRSYFINSTGFNKYDLPLWIEYNGILRKENIALSVEKLVESLPSDWEEIIFPGMGANTKAGGDLVNWALNFNKNKENYKVIIQRDLPSYYVNLEVFDKKGENYIKELGSNTRSQIKRSYKEYAKEGEIKVEVAQDKKAAINIYNNMVEVHKKAWQNKNKCSNFLSKVSQEFHLRLIENFFDNGGIQLIRIKCGQRIIGCLYNLIHLGHVSFYQNGINYEDNPRVKAGLVCHIEAIKYNMINGMKAYDFLAGDEKYKQNLCTDKNRIVWFKIQKRKIKFNIEDTILRLYKKFKKRT